jgi:hypothetical protein
MASIEYKLEIARRDFLTLLGEIHDWIGALGPAERILGICGFSLVVLWLAMRKPTDYETHSQMGRQFNMALLMVMLFGLGVGGILETYAKLAGQIA